MSKSRTRLTEWLCLLIGVWCTLSSPAAGQDTVFVRGSDNSARPLRKEGVILDYTGAELKLKTIVGSEETIPAGRIVEIVTTWPASYESGRTARVEGRLDEAISLFRQAKRQETRAWAVRQIMADLAGCYLEIGRIDHAGDEFLVLAASDPHTRHFNAIPLAWRAAPPDPALEARASAWLAAKDKPISQLLGASWLLPTTGKRAEATAVLGELSRSSDPRIAAAAAIQLWRTKLVTASPAEIARWQTQLTAMPTEAQAAGWYVLGDLRSRQKQPEEAALAYLKGPLLFPEQRALGADALVAAGGELAAMGRNKQAATLYREVLQRFPGLVATKEAERRLATLAGDSR